MTKITLAGKFQSRGVWLAVLAATTGWAAGPARGQDETGVRVYDEQIRVALDKQLPSARETGVQGGGWFAFSLFDYDDAAAQTERTMRRFQLRGWASVNLQGVHQAYFRGLLQYDDWNQGNNPRNARGDDEDQLVERAWYEFNLGQLMRNQGQQPDVDVKVKVGREFATIGTALALSMPLDMVQLNLACGEWELMALLGKSVRSTRNIDDSYFVSDHQDRCFWGAELAYTGLDRHRPFVYYLRNLDDTAPRPADPFQKYEYSSHYVGVGSTGSVLLPDLRYQVEVVGEWGKTYSNGVTAGGKDDICAMAANAALEYYFRVPTQPRVMVEYLYGSGDSDRLTSATSTVGGNLAGTRDEAFNAFGFRDTGIAFAPRVSNIHAYVLGASCFPLERMEAFKRLEVGTKLFFYHKAKSDGPISDATAANNSSWLGWEWDAYFNWRVTSDLAWTVRYGAFQPGEAYSSPYDSCRQFVYTGVVLSF